MLLINIWLNFKYLYLYRFGKNFFTPPKIKGIYEIVMDNFDDTINKVLLGAALVSIAIGLF